MRDTAFPIVLIVLGAAWLAQEVGWLPEWRLVIAAGLVVIGFAILLVEGINRSSIVAGPLFVYAGIAWLLRQHGLLPERVIWPLGLVLLGVCLFVGRIPGIPDGRRRRRSGRTDTPGT